MSRLYMLSETENEQLKQAFAQIAILIAGADGNIEEDETDWAKKVVKIRSFSGESDLMELHAELDKTMSERLDNLLTSLPSDVAEREQILTDRISALNPVLQKVDNDVAFELYTGYKSYAEHIAKAAGGFLRIGSISSAERKLIDLPMLTEIVLSDEEE